MKKVKICVHKVNGVWIARDSVMRFAAKGEGETPLAALMNLLRKLGEVQFELEELRLVEPEDENEESLLYVVTVMARWKIPIPSIN